MEKLTRAAKFAVIFDGYRSSDLKVVGKSKKGGSTIVDGVWKDIWTAQDELTMAANKLMSALYQVKMGTMPHPTKEDGKPVHLQTLADRGMRGDWQPFGHPLYQPTRRAVGSKVLGATASLVYTRINTDFKDILRGNKSLTVFRTLPLYAKGAGVQWLDRDRVKVCFWATKRKVQDYWPDEVKARVNESPYVTFRPYGVKGGQRSILNRCADGDYKVGDISLRYDQRIKKWMMSMAWTGQITKKAGATVMGVDVGIANAAVVGFIDSDSGKIAKYRRTIRIPENVFRAFRRLRSERSQRLSWNKEATGARAGKGRQRKLRVDSLGDKIRRVTRTALQQVASSVVNEAIKCGAHTIAVENLTNWSVKKHLADTENLEGKKKARAREFYKLWHHGELLQLIKSAAEREGLSVVAVNPAYTSRTCASCGEVHKEVKDGYGRVSQDKFRCQCGWEVHADYNASLNIAMRGKEALDKKEKAA